MIRVSQNITAAAAAAMIASAPVAAWAEGHAMANAVTQFEELEWMPMAEDSPAEISILWGNPETGPVGLLIRLPVGFEVPLHWHSSNYHAVVIQGAHQHWVEDEDRAAIPTLPPGSYFSQVAEQAHGDANAGDVPMIGFVYFDGPLDSIPKE